MLRLRDVLRHFWFHSAGRTTQSSAQRNEWPLAVRIAASAKHAARRMPTVFQGYLGQLHTRTVSDAQARLAPGDFDVAWAEGEALSLEEAAELALRA